MERKEKKKVEKKISSPLPLTTARKIMHHYAEKDTQIEADAVIVFQGAFTDMSEWVMIEAEKLARYRGNKTITKDDVRSAVVKYLGAERK